MRPHTPVKIICLHFLQKVSDYIKHKPNFESLRENVRLRF